MHRQNQIFVKSLACTKLNQIKENETKHKVQTSNNVVISLPAMRRNTSGGGFTLTFIGFGRDSGRVAEFLFSTLLLLLWIVRGKACGGFGLITSTKNLTTKENKKKKS